LGLAQGLTEFLPVSSSGHLVILGHFFPEVFSKPITFGVLLHLATLLALIFYFWRDWKKIISVKLFLPVIIATIATVVFVFPLRPFIEDSFKNPKIAGAMLVITGFLLLFASLRKNNKEENINFKKAGFIGFIQGLAILPGISRSGATISAGIFSGLKSGTAAYFSFLIAVPAILAAVILEAKNLTNIPDNLAFPYVFGFFIAFLSGFFSLRFLIKLISLDQRKLIYFAYYCWLAGLTALILVK